MLGCGVAAGADGVGSGTGDVAAVPPTPAAGLTATTVAGAITSASITRKAIHMLSRSCKRQAADYVMLERTDGNQPSNGESSHRMVSSRWGPVEIRQKGTPVSSSSRSR